MPCWMVSAGGHLSRTVAVRSSCVRAQGLGDALGPRVKGFTKEGIPDQDERVGRQAQNPPQSTPLDVLGWRPLEPHGRRQVQLHGQVL